MSENNVNRQTAPSSVPDVETGTDAVSGECAVCNKPVSAHHCPPVYRERDGVPVHNASTYTLTTQPHTEPDAATGAADEIRVGWSWLVTPNGLERVASILDSAAKPNRRLSQINAEVLGSLASDMRAHAAALRTPSTGTAGHDTDAVEDDVVELRNLILTTIGDCRCSDGGEVCEGCAGQDRALEIIDRLHPPAPDSLPEQPRGEASGE